MNIFDIFNKMAYFGASANLGLLLAGAVARDTYMMTAGGLGFSAAMGAVAGMTLADTPQPKPQPTPASTPAP